MQSQLLGLRVNNLICLLGGRIGRYKEIGMDAEVRKEIEALKLWIRQLEKKVENLEKRTWSLPAIRKGK